MGRGRGRRPGRLPGEGSGNGRAPAKDGRESQIKHLWERHHKMKRLALLGMSTKDIAAEVGMTPTAVSHVMNSELMKREMSLMRAALDLDTIDVAKKIQDAAAAAAVMLTEFMESVNTPIHIRTKIGLEMLSRGGYCPQLKVTGVIDHRHFTDQEIEDIKTRALEAARLVVSSQEIRREEVLDAEFSEIPESRSVTDMPDSNYVPSL